MSIRPVFDNVVIKPLSEEQKMGALVVPDSVKKKPEVGEVIESATPEFNKGDKVVYNKYVGREIEIDDTVYLIIDKKEILAVYENDRI